MYQWQQSNYRKGKGHPWIGLPYPAHSWQFVHIQCSHPHPSHKYPPTVANAISEYSNNHFFILSLKSWKMHLKMLAADPAHCCFLTNSSPISVKFSRNFHHFFFLNFGTNLIKTSDSEKKSESLLKTARILGQNTEVCCILTLEFGW